MKKNIIYMIIIAAFSVIVTITVTVPKNDVNTPSETEYVPVSEVFIPLPDSKVNVGQAAETKETTAAQFELKKGPLKTPTPEDILNEIEHEYEDKQFLGIEDKNPEPEVTQKAGHIEYERHRCETCGGTGRVDCDVCEGKGAVTKVEYTDEGAIEKPEQCPFGTDGKKSCGGPCNGNGFYDLPVFVYD